MGRTHRTCQVDSAGHPSSNCARALSAISTVMKSAMTLLMVHTSNNVNSISPATWYVQDKHGGNSGDG